MNEYQNRTNTSSVESLTFAIQQKYKRVYLSGKMNGLPDNGFGYFNKEAANFRSMGFEVINPAENLGQSCWEDYMKVDIAGLVSCDLVAVLNNWKDSRGAKIEVALAKELKIPVIQAETLKPLEEENVAEEATRLVYGDRQQSYGHPKDDYDCATDVFNALMRKKYPGKWHDMQSEDGCTFQKSVKWSREMNAHKRDNSVDDIGYTLCYNMILEKKRESGK